MRRGLDDDPPGAPGEAAGPGRPAPFHILVFLHSFDPGGVERIALRLAGRWAEDGSRVSLAMGRRWGPLDVEAPRNVTYDHAPPLRFSRHFESLWLVPRLVLSVRRRRPDVLFCAGNTYAIVAVLARLLLGASCPPIICKISNALVRPDFPRRTRTLYRLWLRIQARTFAAFVALSDAMRDEIIQEAGAAPERVVTVPDPALSEADLSRVPRRSESRPDAGRVFVGVGRLVRQKDFALLLRAFALGRGPRDRLILLGDGPERRQLEDLAAELAITDHVTFTGHVPDPRPWMAMADALVLSSLYEGAPAVLFEALGEGLPVVATDCCPGMDALLGGQAFGRLVAGRRPEDLAAAMFGPLPAIAPQAVAEHLRGFTIERAAPSYLRLMTQAASVRRWRGALPVAAVEAADGL
ncbi:MAG: glycosyltransferase [Phenylobacterium sp.]|uniref:glycosyltransferase n=1 Tax=Phenylobacterium sp. TaxID=1871053 RepID=UPI0025F29BAE|nr:glycosyltransferase [Phenylobacterium sp.]MBI1200791.1 glycosyltransferase [Phenylobacterium sp.]